MGKLGLDGEMGTGWGNWDWMGKQGLDGEMVTGWEYGE